MLMIQDPFWSELYSQANIVNFFLFIIVSTIYALGFSTSHKKNPGPTLAFLALHLVYSTSSALVRLSGWRFIQPADWILFCMFAFGLMDLIRFCILKFFRNIQFSHISYWHDLPEMNNINGLSLRGITIYGALFLVLGGFIPLREALFPMNVPVFSREEICSNIHDGIQNSMYSEEFEEFKSYCLESNIRIYYGIGVYPRYFKNDEGYFDRSDNLHFGVQEFSRLVFRVVGPRNTTALFRTDYPEISFPNGSIVFIVGKKEKINGYQFLYIPGQQPEIIFSEPLLSGSDPIS
jgi:hypothetical protein